MNKTERKFLEIKKNTENGTLQRIPSSHASSVHAHPPPPFSSLLHHDLSGPRPHVVDDRHKLLQRAGVARKRVPLSVVEQLGRVLVAHAEEGHGAVNVGVVAADYVAGGNVDEVLALVGEQTMHLVVVVESHRRPPGEKDCILFRGVFLVPCLRFFIRASPKHRQDAL